MRWGGSMRPGIIRAVTSGMPYRPIRTTPIQSSRRRRCIRNVWTIVLVSAYPLPSSDIVALLVMEHQMRMLNLMTRVGWEARA